jgi:hypothetical protein
LIEVQDCAFHLGLDRGDKIVGRRRLLAIAAITPTTSSATPPSPSFEFAAAITCLAAGLNEFRITLAYAFGYIVFEMHDGVLGNGFVCNLTCLPRFRTTAAAAPSTTSTSTIRVLALGARLFPLFALDRFFCFNLRSASDLGCDRQGLHSERLGGFQTVNLLRLFDREGLLAGYGRIGADRNVDLEALLQLT